MLLNLARGLRDAGYAVELVVARAEGAFLEQVPGDVPLVNLGVSRARRAVRPLAEYLRTTQPTVLFATLNYVNIVALRAARRADVRPSFRAVGCGVAVRVVVREANVVIPETYPRLRDKLLLALMRRYYRRAHAVVVNSSDTRDGLIARRIARPEQVSVIGNLLDLEAVRRAAAAPPPHPWLRPSAHPAGGPVVVAVGSLSPQKDFVTLLQSIARLRKRAGRETLRAIICGEGPERSRLERTIAELGLNEAVALVGYVDNPYAYLRHAGLFCLSSRYEGNPNVVLEALAVGTPVVATDCPGGAKELLEWGAYGPLVPVGDPEALEEAIDRRLSAPRDSERLRARAAEFSAPALLPHYLAAMGLADTPDYPNHVNNVISDPS